jgi:hypothetical protein
VEGIVERMFCLRQQKVVTGEGRRLRAGLRPALTSV